LASKALAFRNKSWSPIPDRPQDTLVAAARRVLETPSAATKALLSHKIAADWRSNKLDVTGHDDAHAAPLGRPARPLHPELRMPRDMPRRRLGAGVTGRIALLHAVAHIELNAIDLAWDIIARFAAADLPRAFCDDWVKVADEEAKHFELLSSRLDALGAAYGDLPAHDGLWQAAESTSHDLLARLAIAPLLLEARGLDVTPGMINKLEKVGDNDSAAVLNIIYRDEIGHVATGVRWFRWVTEHRTLDPQTVFKDMVARYFKSGLKPPFNKIARDAAAFPASWYEPLSEPAKQEPVRP
jgi:uncharacterized ferritin-like protein (DUF455 family)